MTVCPLCGSEGLTALPVHLGRAMRSDGLVLEEPLRKLSCPGCGALIGRNTDTGSAYFRSNGQSRAEIGRHERVAEGLQTLIRQLGVPGPVLEVGAANFQTAMALARRLPDRRVTALEPSPEKIPDTPGIDVHIGTLDTLDQGLRFAVIYANHVLEHIPDPTDFLRRIEERLSPGGVALIICPSALIPSHELLFSDHLFHFTPRALACAAKAAGLGLAQDMPAPWEALSRLFVLDRSESPLPPAPPDLTGARRSYLGFWERAEEDLLSRMDGDIVLFGAGEFSQLIRAYLPRVFARVSLITLDDIVGARDFDRPTVPLASLDLAGRTVLAGVHPASLAPVSERLRSLGAACVLSVTLG